MNSDRDSELLDDPALADLPARFELRERLGRGGMATVYRARDTVAQTEVALKVLHPHLRDDELVVARFRREIAAARRAAHPNIIRIHDLVATARLDCLVLEYHPGEDLKRVLRRRGALPVDEALALALQVLDGLACAHRAGVVHRDIKPHNILVDAAGVAKIADFGLARVDDLIGVTTHTMSLGTPEYMAPELLGSAIVDGRADLYGVGVVLFELLTGKLPFRASTPLALLNLHQNQAPPDVCSLDPSLPSWLGAVVARAMAKAPEDRFATAREMAEALRAGAEALALVAAAGPVSVRSCPRCAAPLLPGVASCVECGAERVFIAERPRGGGRVLLDQNTWIARDASEQDFLTFTDKARIAETLKRLGGRLTDNDRGVDLALRAPPVILAKQLSEADGEALVLELRIQGLESVRYVPERRQVLLMAKMGKFWRNSFWAMIAGALFTLVVGTESFAVWALVSTVFWLVFTWLRALASISPLARFDAGRGGVRRSGSALIEQATRVFARIESDRLRRMTRRIVSRGMQLRQLVADTGRDSEAMVANLDQVMTRSLTTAERVAELELAVASVDVAELHERMATLEQRAAEASDIHELDDIAEEQAALRAQLADLDEHQGEIVRLSGQLLDASSRLAKMLRDGERGAADSLTSMSVILGDLEHELQAHRELDAELENG